MGLVGFSAVRFNRFRYKGIAVNTQGYGVFVCFTLPVFAFVALRIWRPSLPSKPRKSVADRIAWTFFALGICLMFHMVLLAAAMEDRGFRSRETIRYHGRWFLAIAVIPIAGPLAVFLYQVPRSHPPKSPDKKPSVNDLE